jgi:UPF0716 protein FxsA
MPLLLVVAFVAVPLIELVVILQVGQLVGVWPTVLLLVADSILGAVLLRSQGRSAWRRFSAALGERRPPAREVLDGVIIVFGGALLLTPGFVTDALGLACLLPPTRAALRGVLVRRFAQRMVVSFAGGPSRRPAGTGASPGRGFDVEGTATEAGDPPRLP